MLDVNGNDDFDDFVDADAGNDDDGFAEFESAGTAPNPSPSAGIDLFGTPSTPALAPPTFGAPASAPQA